MWWHSIPMEVSMGELVHYTFGRWALGDTIGGRYDGKEGWRLGPLFWPDSMMIVILRIWKNFDVIDLTAMEHSHSITFSTSFILTRWRRHITLTLLRVWLPKLSSYYNIPGDIDYLWLGDPIFRNWWSNCYSRTIHSTIYIWHSSKCHDFIPLIICIQLCILGTELIYRSDSDLPFSDSTDLMGRRLWRRLVIISIYFLITLGDGVPWRR